jgi:homoserine kinase type II
MSVYTAITNEELKHFLSYYNVGELKEYRGISDGIENTNYFVDASDNNTTNHFVLTLFEHHSFEEMQYYLNLMHHLADNQVPSANPVADNNGDYLRTLKNKPAALVERLAGKSIRETTVSHCEQIGTAMGKMHAAGLSFKLKQTNPRGSDWRVHTANTLQKKLPDDDLKLLNEEIIFQKANDNNNLPKGVIHADLFRDNVLWDGDRLSGFIDFYYACDDVLLYDLAVTVNDWCCLEDYSLNHNKVSAILNGYNKHRQLLEIEQQCWPVLLRAAALRFWLSRLYDKHFPRPGELVHIKNPDEFKSILKDRITRHDEYQSYWLD